MSICALFEHVWDDVFAVLQVERYEPGGSHHALDEDFDGISPSNEASQKALDVQEQVSR